MGIAERDYSRRPPTRTGGPPMRPRGWSVTTWLIAINVAVFVLANVVVLWPATPTYMGEKRLPQVSKAEWSRGELGRLQARSPLTGDTYAVVDPQTGRELGVKRYGHMPLLRSWGHFSAGRLLRGQWDWVPEVWRFITFQFLHANSMHLMLNMLGLFFFAPLVEDYLGRRRFLTFYLLCGAAGGAMYLVLVALGNIAIAAGVGVVPGLLVEDWYTPLIGASAGVFGVLLACAYIAPNEIVYLMFLPVPLKMRTVAWGFFGIAVLSLLRGSPNAGGEAAHIGGALAGWFLIKRPYWLRDVLRALRLDDGRLPAPSPGARGVDRILAKVQQEGVGSLTPRERRLLHRASQIMRG